MDLSKHTLEECLDFIEKEGYTIKNYINKIIRKIITLYYIFVIVIVIGDKN